MLVGCAAPGRAARARLVALVAAASLAAGGCAAEHPSGSSPRTTQLPAAALPPDNVAALAPIIDPVVRPLDLRVTRVVLVNPKTADAGPTAPRLELYVAPITPFSDDRYIGAILPLARALTPFVLQRWPGLSSFEVCQEALGVEGSASPETQTVFDVSRDYGLATEWSRVELSTLVADYRGGRAEIRLAVTPRLQPALDTVLR